MIFIPQSTDKFPAASPIHVFILFSYRHSNTTSSHPSLPTLPSLGYMPSVSAPSVLSLADKLCLLLPLRIKKPGFKKAVDQSGEVAKRHSSIMTRQVVKNNMIWTTTKQWLAQKESLALAPQAMRYRGKGLISVICSTD